MLPELYWLTLTVLLTAVLWVPYILKFIFEVGLVKALTEGGGTSTPDAKWAARLKKAHANAVENLVVFAPLVLIAVFTQTTTAVTAMAAMVYFFARFAHAVIFLLGVPLLRTLTFTAGFVCQIIFAFTILGWM